MTKTLFNTFPTACVSGATRSKVLVAICNFKFKPEVRKQTKGLQQNAFINRAGEQRNGIVRSQKMQKPFKFESHH